LPLHNAHALDEHALPANGDVVGGDANFDYQGNQLDIHQNTNRVVIDWDSFNIGADDPTQILGSLKANGTVMVLDRNGVMFGQDSRVDVGGLVVSTGEIDTDAFMNGADILEFSNISGGGAIALKGQITVADAGLAAFVAPSVVNSGVINAKMGRVALASGEAATLDLYGDGLIEIAADDALTGALIDNTGTIEAHGGVVQLSVPMVESVVDNLINMDGVIDVSSATQEGGSIVLEGGNARVSGTLKAEGKSKGGTIYVGGEYQGSGDTLRAQTTIVSAEALLSANSTDHGDGGEIIIWADKATRYEGTVEAKGGPNGGDGGFVEVSGKNYLEFAGDVDLSGETLGTLLLDPDDIDIVAGASNPAEFADDFITFVENGGGTSTIGADTLSGRLSANANVILQANNTIDVNADVTSTGSGDLTLETGVGGTITVNNAIDVNAGDLTLIADEIDILANLSGSGDIQLTSADVTQEIEIGSTDATDLNLTATELGFLQDGWNQITIGGTDHDATTAVNEAITFSDTLRLINKAGSGAITAPIDINAAITTTDNSDLILTGKANPAGVHGFRGVHVGGDLNVARDLIVNASAGSSYETGTIVVGRDFTINQGNASTFDVDVSVGGDFNYTQTAQGFSLSAGHTIDVVGDIEIDAGSHSGGTQIVLQAGAALEADGDITLESETISLDATASIRGNADGSSNLTFLEGGQDEDMEVGSQGTYDWSLNASELTTIQDGFDTITFGSDSMTEEIRFGADVSSFSSDFVVNGGVVRLLDTVLGSGDFTTEAGTAGVNGSVILVGDITKNVAGASTFNLKARRAIRSTSSSDITATNGSLNVILNADSDNNDAGYIELTGLDITTNGGNFTAGGGLNPLTDSAHGDVDGVSDQGVLIQSTDINTGAGDIYIRGVGEDTADNNYGIYLYNGSTLSTTSGAIMLNGTGGAGTDNNYGVFITDSSTRIESTDGNISITGTGGGGGLIGNDNNYGVYIHSGADIVSNSSAISISGRGGNGDRLNYGVRIRGNGTTLETDTGDITVIGDTASVLGDKNIGIILESSAEIISTGSGVNAGTITLNGTGGNGTSDNYGVHLLGDTTHITSVDGAISIDGTGGRAATGSDNEGIYLHDGADIFSTGTTADAATITLTGLAGNGASEGVYIHGGTIVSGYGDITITGTDDAVSGARGVFISNFDTAATETKIRSTGTGDNAADITIGGISDSNDGVFLHVNAGVETQDGDIEINATGRRGAYLRFTSYIESFGTGVNAGDITINGTGVDDTGNTHGVELAQSSFIRSVDGNIGITGQGGDTTGGIAHGIVVGENNNSRIISTGSADITLDGTAGDCNLGSCYGVYLPDAITNENHISTTSSGSIDITGRGGDIGSNNYGIFAEGGSYIESTASGTDAGTITLNGTGGEAVDDNTGVLLSDSGTLISSVDGDIEIIGRGGNATGNTNRGIYVTSGADIISNGTGVNAANITLRGTGGSGSNTNSGVLISGSSPNVNSTDGDILVYANGGGDGTGVSNYGYISSNGGELRSFGDGNVYVDGRGGLGTNNNRGIFLDASGNRFRTNTGSIELLGVGGGTGTGNDGVSLGDGNSTGIASNGDISITGTSSNTGLGNGIYFGTTTNIGNENPTSITLITDSLETQAANISSTGDLTIRNRTSGTSIGLGGGAGDLNIDDAELAQFTVGGKLTIGSSNAGLVTIDSVDVTAGAYATDIIGRSITVDNGLDVANSVYLRATQGDIRLNSGTVSAEGGGNSLILNAAGDFINNAGVGALDAGVGGRFLAYADDFDASVLGGVTGNIIKGETFESLPPVSVPAGNSFIFAKDPIVDVANAQIARIQNVTSDSSGYTLKSVKVGKVEGAGSVKAVVVEADGDEVTLIDGVSCSVSGASSSNCILN